MVEGHILGMFSKFVDCHIIFVKILSLRMARQNQKIKFLIYAINFSLTYDGPELILSHIETRIFYLRFLLKSTIRFRKCTALL